MISWEEELNKNELIKYRNLILEGINSGKKTDEVVKEVLERISFTESSGLYVCTYAYYTDCDISYEDTSFYYRKVPINSLEAEYRIYMDIENGDIYKGTNNLINKKLYNLVLFSEFEPSHIILNPYNTCDNQNGYQEVRLDYFKSLLDNSPSKSKKIVLSKYKRL